MRVPIVVASLAMLVAAPAGAARHHPTRHDRHEHRAERRASGPAGTTAVPPGGLKIYCPGRSNPLLVRKFTQGNGTTVTVLCR